MSMHTEGEREGGGRQANRQTDREGGKGSGEGSGRKARRHAKRNADIYESRDKFGIRIHFWGCLKEPMSSLSYTVLSSGT